MPPARLVECLGLAGLVLAGHAVGGGTTTGTGLLLLAGATLAVTALARHTPSRSPVGDLVLAVVAQAAGHLALALAGGAAADPATGRMLLGHALSTAAVAALVRHGRMCWSRAGRLLAQVLWAWWVVPLHRAPELPDLRPGRRDDDQRVAGAPVRGAIARRGPPAVGCAAYA